MSDSLGEAVLELSTDNTKLDRGLKRGLSSTKEMVGHAGHAVRGMGVSMGLAVLPLIEAGREGAKKLGELQIAGEQTTAVIRSTGGAAKISAFQIHQMSEHLGDVAGVAPDVVQAGENMMLTFRNVQNRAGEGNNIFTKSSHTMMDFATAMHMGPTAAALAMGKALNDPEKGMGRLQRMGVTFTDSQKKAAKSMQDSGNVAGAQKVILGELKKEFGGSAAAAGKTFPAAMARLKDSFQMASASVVQGLLPQLTALFKHISDGIKWFNQLSPGVKHFAGMLALTAVVAAPVLMVFGEMLVGIEGLLGVLALVASPIGLIVVGLGALGAMWLRSGNHMQVFKADIQKVANYIKNVAWPAIIQGAQKAMRWYQANIAPTIKAVVTNVTQTLQQWGAWAKAFWQKWGDDIMRVVKPAFTQLKTYIASAVKVIGGIIDVVLAVMRGDWGDAWKSLKGAASAALTGVIALIKGLGPILLTAAKIAFQLIGKGALAALKALPGIVVGAVKLAAQGIWNLAGWLLSQSVSLAGNIISGLAQGIANGAAQIISAMEGLAGKALDAAKRKLHIHSPSQVFRDEVGLPIMQGIAAGMTLGLPGVIAAQSNALDALKKSNETAVATAKFQYDQASAAYKKVGTLKAARAALHRAEVTAATRVRSALIQVEHANQAVTAAAKTKGTQDDRIAKMQLANAKANLVTQRHAVSTAKTNLAMVAKLAAAYTAAQVAAFAAEKEAAKAEADAQAAIDAVQAKQDALDAGLNAIKDKASLALNTDAMSATLGGGTPAQIAAKKAQLEAAQKDLADNGAAMTQQARDDAAAAIVTLNQQLADLQGVGTAALSNQMGDLTTEYDNLKAYLAANIGDLSTSAQADVVGTMNDLLQQVADVQQQIYDTTHPDVSVNDTTSTSTDGVVGDAGAGAAAARVTVVQQFSSEPDMFAASRSALFAYQTAGLVAG